MTASARKLAQAAGEKRYFSGRACVKGHLADRYTSSGACTECWSAHVAANDDRLKRYYRERYSSNRDKVSAYGRARYALKRDEVLASNKRWQEQNKGKVLLYKRVNKARRRAAVGTFTKADVEFLMRHQRGECAMCAKNIKAGFHVDHIIPLSRGGSNWCGNIQLLCPPCNLTKLGRLPVELRVTP